MTGNELGISLVRAYCCGEEGGERPRVREWERFVSGGCGDVFGGDAAEGAAADVFVYCDCDGGGKGFEGDLRGEKKHAEEGRGGKQQRQQ